MAELPRLADLELESMDLPAASVAPLSRLAGSLTRLQLTCCSVPAALPALTRLQHLSVRDCSEADDRGGAIAAALPNLLQLTCLVSAMQYGAPCPPARPWSGHALPMPAFQPCEGGVVWKTSEKALVRACSSKGTPAAPGWCTVSSD